LQPGEVPAEASREDQVLGFLALHSANADVEVARAAAVVDPVKIERLAVNRSGARSSRSWSLLRRRSLASSLALDRALARTSNRSPLPLCGKGCVMRSFIGVGVSLFVSGRSKASMSFSANGMRRFD
jgi:hypothetical protein